eukprot:3755121-Rhodomonas_salina.1
MGREGREEGVGDEEGGACPHGVAAGEIPARQSRWHTGSTAQWQPELSLRTFRNPDRNPTGCHTVSHHSVGHGTRRVLLLLLVPWCPGYT